jgi:HSP20 family protein
MTAAIRTAHADEHSTESFREGRWVTKVVGHTYRTFHPSESWAPAINLYQNETEYVVVADLAGVRSETIDLYVADGMLVLSGQRNPPQVPDGRGKYRVHLMEIDHGPFCRRVELPGDVNVDAIAASYRCGMLFVRIPRSS